MTNEQSSGLFRHNICFEIDPSGFMEVSLADTERRRFAKSYLRQFQSLFVTPRLPVRHRCPLSTVECVETPIMFSFNYHFLSSLPLDSLICHARTYRIASAA